MASIALGQTKFGFLGRNVRFVLSVPLAVSGMSLIDAVQSKP